MSEKDELTQTLQAVNEMAEAIDRMQPLIFAGEYPYYYEKFRPIGDSLLATIERELSEETK